MFFVVPGCVTVFFVMCAGINKVDEKLKVGRAKQTEGILLDYESQKKQLTLVSSKRELPCHYQGKQIPPQISPTISFAH